MSIEDFEKYTSSRASFLVFGDGMKNILHLFFKKIFPVVSDITVGKNPLLLIPSRYATQQNKFIDNIDIDGTVTDVWLINSLLLNNAVIMVAETVHAKENYKKIVEKLHICSTIMIDADKAMAKEDKIKCLNDIVSNEQTSTSVIILYGHHKQGATDVETLDMAVNKAVEIYRQKIKNIHVHPFHIESILSDCLNVLTFQPANHLSVKAEIINKRINNAKEAVNDDYLMKTFFRNDRKTSSNEIIKQINKWPALKIVLAFLPKDYEKQWQAFINKPDYRNYLKTYLLNLLTC